MLQSHLTLATPWMVAPPSFSVHGIIPARILRGLSFSSPWDLPQPGIKLRDLQSSDWQRFFTTELPGNP